MIEWQTLYSWQRDWSAPSQQAVVRRREFYDRRSSNVKGQLVNGINHVREGHARLGRDYCFGYIDQLAPDSSVASTPRMRRLLEIADQRLSSKYLGDQVWFEAISMFDQALSVALIEQNEPMEHVGLTMERLIKLLSEEFFVGGFDKIDFYAHHDPEDAYVVPPGNVGFNRPLNRPGTCRRKMRLNCRRIRDDGIAFLHHRLKDPFRTWLKIQRQLKEGKVEDPYDVSDRCGLTLVVPAVQTVLEIGEEVLDLLVKHGGVITEAFTHNYDVDTPNDEKNGDSSAQYKCAKGAVFWNGLEIEFQFVTFADHFSGLRALNDINHELYKLKQAMNCWLPLLWPASLYDVDWSNPRVRGTLRAWKISQLGWAVRETPEFKEFSAFDTLN